VKLRSDNVAGGIYLVTVLVLLALIWWATGCATTPKAKAHRAAVLQKIGVDGVGRGYLDYCRIIRKPSCVAADEKATQAGAPQTRDDRVACLRPCDSQTAEKIKAAVDAVRTAQTVIFELLRGDPTDEELAASRKQLARAASELLQLLDDEGVTDLLGQAVGK
jgi:hypothetical protein